MVVLFIVLAYVYFFFKQKTAYEMRISDWSSDVCSSDLRGRAASRRCRKPGCRGRGRKSAPRERGARSATARRAGETAWSSGPRPPAPPGSPPPPRGAAGRRVRRPPPQIGRAAWRERVGQSV